MNRREKKDFFALERYSEISIKVMCLFVLQTLLLNFNKGRKWVLTSE